MSSFISKAVSKESTGFLWGLHTFFFFILAYYVFICYVSRDNFMQNLLLKVIMNFKQKGSRARLTADEGRGGLSRS